MSALAAAACWLLTPFVRSLAVSNGWFDMPGHLKIHRSPTPRLGGVAMMGALILATAIAPAEWRPALVVIGALVGVWLIGLIDDVRSTSPLLRLAVQIAAGVALWTAGWRLDWPSDHFLNLAATTLFFALVINAMNFLDGMDGMTLVVSWAMAGGFIILLATSHIGPSLWLACAVLALCTGMLFHNYPPAKIFIGDSGSTLLGAAFAFLYLDWVRVTPDQSTHGALLLFAALPLGDALVAIIRRLRANVSPLAGDRSHFYDLLRQAGWTVEQVLLFSFIATCSLVATALCCVWGLLNPRIAIIVAVALAAIGAYFLGSFAPDRPENLRPVAASEEGRTF